MKPRNEIAKEECTCNPIFLFQKGIIRVYPDSPICYDSSLDTTVYTKNGEPITNEQILEEGYGWIEWYTEHVWATREEAEEWGRTHAYRYRASDGKDGKPGKDWKVFCVPCCGELAELLEEYDKEG